MTEEKLLAIDERARLAVAFWSSWKEPARARCVSQDIPALVAEVRRLRSTIAGSLLISDLSRLHAHLKANIE